MQRLFAGREEIGERAFIVQVLMLQVGDQKAFGHRDAYHAPLATRALPGGHAPQGM